MSRQKSCNVGSQCKYHKNNVKCSQYRQSAREDHSNAGNVDESTDTPIVSKSESGEDNS